MAEGMQTAASRAGDGADARADAPAGAPSIGFVGLGNQGGPIAERIAGAGFPLAVWARRPEALAPFTALGATAAADVPALGARDIVGICVVDDAGVREVFAALLPALSPGAIVMILSTVHPDTCRDLAEQAGARGVAVIDAPVSGGGDAARAGTLAVMIGGAADAVARCRPVIESFAGLIVHLGEIGAGQYAKLVNNSLLTANLALAEEAVRAGVALGIDRAALLTLLAASSGRSFGLDILARLPNLAAFAGGAALLRKDVGLLAAAAGARGADAAHLIETGNLFLAAVDRDHATRSKES